ncbi:hypothetical protein ACFL18_00730 [Patescibacteria group bacterium]
MSFKSSIAYLILIIILASLGLVYLNLAVFRLPIAILIGLAYFIWGVYAHWRDKTLHLLVVLEYLGLSLLAVTILIFISLRA